MRSAVAAMVVAVALVSTACTADDGGSAPTGRFYVKDSADAPEITAVVGRAAALVNRRVRLPHDVPIEVLACTDGTGYDPEERQIHICVPEVEETAAMLEAADADDRDAVAEGILVETVTHEAGHAVLDALEASFTGREEDVADQFSAYVLGADGAGGADVLEEAAYGYEVSVGVRAGRGRRAHGGRAARRQSAVLGLRRRPSRLRSPDRGRRPQQGPRRAVRRGVGRPAGGLGTVARRGRPVRIRA